MDDLRSHRKRFLFVKLTRIPLWLLSLLKEIFFSWFLFYSIVVFKRIFGWFHEKKLIKARSHVRVTPRRFMYHYSFFTTKPIFAFQIEMTAQKTSFFKLRGRTCSFIENGSRLFCLHFKFKGTNKIWLLI